MNIQKQHDREREIRCQNLLMEWGVSPKCIGFQYMVECVILGTSSHLFEACEEVGKRQGISGRGVYAAIDHALKTAKYDPEAVPARHGFFVAGHLRAKNIYSSLRYYSTEENY